MPNEVGTNKKDKGSLTEFFGSTIGILGTYTYSKENRAKMFAAHALGVMDAGVQVATPMWAAKWLVETRVAAQQNTPVDYFPLWVALSGLCFSLVLPRIRSFLIDPVKRNVQQQITLDMVKKVYDSELDELLGQPTGQPAAIVSKNYGSVQSVMPIFVADLLPSIIETFGISVVLSDKFGKIGSVPILVLMPYLLGAVAGELYSLMLKINNQSTMVEGFGKLLEVINNYTIAHQYGNLDLELEKLEGALSKLGGSFKGVHRAEESTASILSLLTKLGMLGAIAHVYFHPPTPKFWTEDFLLFGYFIMRSNTLAEVLPTKINALFTGLIDTHMIVDFFKKKTTVPDPLEPVRLDLKQAPRIEFDNVSFSYGEGKKGIANISFTIRAGQKIAIMGPTGSGKSTVLKLLQRFYDFTGQIRVNDINIKDIMKDELRSCFSVVSQDTRLMSNTLLENIAYGDRSAKEEDIVAAARYARLNVDRDRFFSGIQQDGSNFSGGEKQRANVARALLKRTSYVFLLDEPTSSLDQQTAKEVHEILDELTVDVTTIMVTHDPNAVMHVDLIVYMEEGEIIEQGSFRELMGLKGAFYNQFLIQCEKLGITPESINPVQKDRTKDAAEFLAWRARRRVVDAVQSDRLFSGGSTIGTELSGSHASTERSPTQSC